MRAMVTHQCRVITLPRLGLSCVATHSARHFPRHAHASHGLGLLDQGAQASASGRGAVQAYAGEVITNNPGEVHDGRPLGADSRRWRIVHLPPHWLEASLVAQPAAHLLDKGNDRADDQAFTEPVIRNPLLAVALRRLLAMMQAAGEREPSRPAQGAATLAIDEALADVCAALAAGRHVTLPLPPAADAAVHAVRERLADELLQPPSLATLAAMVGLSRYQLLRRFRAAYGLPPHAWLLQQRAERARALIRSGAGLAQAAADAGFADQSHMTRTFARHFGYTPGAWLAALR